LQKERYLGQGLNGNVPFAQLIKASMLTDQQLVHFETICFEEKWSNRAQVKLIRIARTIADLSAEREISETSIQEAVQLKRIAASAQNTTIGTPNHG